MVRRLALGALVALVAALVVAAPAQSATQLLPGVSYESSVQFTNHGPVALHVIRGPRPTGLYRLRPVLSNETVLGRERVSSMQKRLSSQATSVGVNGDFFSLADGRPSGLLVRDGVLVTPPHPSRSSAGVMLDGTLDIRKVGLRGNWRGLGARRSLTAINKAPAKNSSALFTSDWGGMTPQLDGNSYIVVLGPFPPAAPSVDIIATVTRAQRGGRVGGIPAGSAVLVSRGTAATKLEAEAPVGTTLTIKFALVPDWEAVSDAIGGGPLLVRNGQPIFRAHEAFKSSQLAPRGPRTAVGQTADGSVLLVATDGRQKGYSVGMTNWELAQTLARLGAVRAMALDGGGSSTLAFDGAVLNRPSGGSERAVSNSLMLQYYGVYSPPPAEAVVSPNGDGVDDKQSLSYKVVRPSEVTVTLTAPDGSAAFQETVARGPGKYAVGFPPPPPPPPPPDDPTQPSPPPPLAGPPAEGNWTLTVNSTDDQGLASSASRRFAVNSTLGFLRLVPSKLVLRKAGGTGTVRWTLLRAARVKVVVQTVGGVLVRVVASRKFAAGKRAVTWNGRARNGKLVAGGTYVIRVEATNALGAISLQQSLTVRRLAE